eukprot:1037727-Pleurochrysis_carterae.AAC.1
MADGEAVAPHEELVTTSAADEEAPALLVAELDEEAPATAEPSSATAAPADAEDEDEVEYEVEEILRERNFRGVKKYLVKWLGYDRPGDNTWEPLEHVEDTIAFEHFINAQKLNETTSGTSHKKRVSGQVEGKPAANQKIAKRTKTSGQSDEKPAVEKKAAKGSMSGKADKDPSAPKKPLNAY